MATRASSPPASPSPNWLDNADHRRWLNNHSDALLSFYERHVGDGVHGGYYWLDDYGHPSVDQGKQLWINARMVHCFSIGVLLGHPGAGSLVEHGLRYLTAGSLRDSNYGGWMWHVASDGSVVDSRKYAYGHAFVLLAACSAALAGFDTHDLLIDSLQILDQHFWDEEYGMYVDVWDQSFSQLDGYRGQNANMHMTEALMAAVEVTGDTRLLERARRIAGRLIRDVTASCSGRLPEHYTRGWKPDLAYNSSDPDNMFRPFGSTVGHWLEWSRLLLQLDAMKPDPSSSWIRESASQLFDRALMEAWDGDRGGFGFTVDWDGIVQNPDRYHWVIAEAIGAACYLYRATAKSEYANWYRRFWDFAATTTIDTENGSWHHQLNSNNAPVSTVWVGKPDLYHALQATLFARVPLGSGIVHHLAVGSRDEGFSQ